MAGAARAAGRGGCGLAAALAALLLCAAPLSAQPPRVHTVVIQGMAFSPGTLQVRPGDQVVWKNADLVPHNVVGRDFHSPRLPPGKSFRWRAREAGALPYRCTLHPGMEATLVVEAAGGS